MSREAERESSDVTRRRPALPVVLASLLALSGLGVAVYGLVSTEPAGLPRPGAEAPVTAMDQGLGVANNSPLLVADPSEPRFVALANRLDAPDFDCALQVSGDRGHRWISVNPVPTLPEGAEKCYAPEVAIDSGGVLYYLFVGLAGAGNEPVGAFLTTSKDRGQTFSRPERVLGPLNFGVRMAIERGTGASERIHLVWINATSDPPLGGFGPPPNPIMTAHSDDGGKTFSTPVQVSDPQRARVVAPALSLASDGVVHVGYFDLEEDAIDYQGLEGSTWDGTWSLVLSTSRDRGATYDRGVVVDDSVTPAERVMLIFTMPPPALATHEGRVCAAWTDARHGDADVLLRCSRDRGRRWGGVRRLNDDRLGNGRTQNLPRLAMSPGGRLDAIFYDRRHDPRNVLNAVFYVNSTDGGRHFSKNVRITRDLFESRIGQRYVNVSAQGQYEFGSRLALWSEPSRVLTAWTDTRNSRTFTGTTGQDIFVAEVMLPTRRRTAVAMTGAGLAAVGLLALATLIVRGRTTTAPPEE